MPNNSPADVVRLLAERYDTKSNVKLGGFRSSSVLRVELHWRVVIQQNSLFMDDHIYISTDYHDLDSNRIVLHEGKHRACSVEIWAPVSVFKESAAKLKPKPKEKLLRCKSTVHIGTLNARTLNRIGHLTELTASAAEHKIDLICIQEHRYYNSEVEIKYHDTGKRWTFIPASALQNSVNAVVEWLGGLLNPLALKSLNSIEKIQTRMKVATFNGNFSTAIISCYSPTNASG